MNKNLEKLRAKAQKTSKQVKSYIHAKRMKLATEIRTNILLPFCKKHNLVMSIGPYCNTFKTLNGYIHDDHDLHEGINDPMAKEIKHYLRIDFMGDHLFDYFMDMDITEKDWT